MPPAAGNFTPPAGWRSRLDAVDQVVNRRSILSGETSAAQTPSLGEATRSEHARLIPSRPLQANCMGLGLLCKNYVLPLLARRIATTGFRLANES